MAVIETNAFVNANINPAFVPKFWTRWINRALWPQATISSYVLNLSSEIVGVDTVNIPNLYVNLPTISTQATQGAEISTQKLAATQTQFQCNTHIYVAYLWGDADLEQVADKYDISYEYARMAQNLIVQTIETALFTLQSSIVSGTQIFTVPNTAGVVAGIDFDLQIRKCIGYFANKGIYQNELRFFVDAITYYNQLAGVSKYYAQYSSDMNLIKSGTFDGHSPTANGHGYVGFVYSLPTYISPLVIKDGGSLSRNLVLHKNAFAYAMRPFGYMQAGNSTFVNAKDGNGSQGEQFVSDAESMNPTLPVNMRTQISYVHKNLAWLCTVDTVYGASVVRLDLACVVTSLQTATTTA